MLLEFTVPLMNSFCSHCHILPGNKMFGKETLVYSFPSATSQYGASQFYKLSSVSGWEAHFLYYNFWRLRVDKPW